MADDTRLAEACLLLNYSNQSYRDMMMSEHLKNNEVPSTTNDNTSKLIYDHSDIKIELKQSIVSPSPADDLQCSSGVSENNTASRESYPSYLDNEELNDSYVELHSKEEDKDNLSDKANSEFCANFPYIDRDPINNLLAAVNCALPSTKSRPSILQRPSGSIHNQTPSSRIFTYPPSILPDHNYCLNQYQNNAPSSNPEQPKAVVIDNFTAQDFSSTSPTSNSIEAPVKHKIVQSKSTRKQKHSTSSEAVKFQRPLKLVAIHLGAGNSYEGTESLQLARSICEEVMLKTPSINNNQSKKKRKNPSHLFSQDNLAQVGECRKNTHNSIENHLNAETAVVQLIKLMEDNQALNCGFGSNLNIKGQVECDASLMSDKNQVWAGVGAVSGCRNPIMLAKSLFDHRTVARPLGLVQPNMLVGSGAKQWMREHCPHLSIVDSKLVSSKAFSTYQKLKSRYDLAIRSFGQDEKSKFSHSGLDGCSPTSSLSRITRELESKCPNGFSVQNNDYTHLNVLSAQLDHGFYCLKTGQNMQKHSSFARATNNPSSLKKDNSGKSPAFYCTEESGIHANHCLDTVGAIAVDFDNNFASAISSGGLLLKFKGRVGQAAIPGAGCWAEDSVAITTTGVGEYLTQTLFARKFYDKMVMLRLLYDLGHVEKQRDLSDLISCAVDECFEDLMKAPALAHVPPQERLAGMLSITTFNSKDSPHRVDNDDLYLSFGHNCNSMCVAYMTCDDIVGHSLMSRKTDEEKFIVEESDSGSSSNTGATVRTLRFTLDSNKFTNSQD